MGWALPLALALGCCPLVCQVRPPQTLCPVLPGGRLYGDNN